MTINVRVRDGMCPDPTTGDGGATEGDIRGSFSDIIDVVGVKDLAGGHLLVTQNSPAAMSVLVAPGVVYIPNADYDELDSNQVKFWEAVITVSTAVVITANTSGSARVDLICAKMDTAVTPDEHASNIATLVAVAGTPGAGAPALPDNHALIAQIAVANGAATIITANITDSRVQSTLNSDYLAKITKTTPIDADSVVLIDSADSNILKKLSWANIKATLKTYFDSIYPTTRLLSKIIAITRDGTAGGADVSYTGVGFTPTSIIFLMNIDAGPYRSDGASDSTKTGRSTYQSAANVYYTINKAITYSNQSAFIQSGDVKSYDADGFTLTWAKTGTPTAGTMKITAICYR